MRLAALLLLALSAHASDVLHVPYLVKHDHESHMVAGALTAIATGYLLPKDTPPWQRRIIQLAIPTALGFAKEYVVDRNADNREALDWTLGAGIVVAAQWEW